MSKAKDQLLEQAHRDFNSSIVDIDVSKLRSVTIPSAELQPMSCPLPRPHTRQEKIDGVAYLIALNSLNYMFWSLHSVNAKKSVARYSFQGSVGANGMRLAFDRAWTESAFKSLSEPPISTDLVTKYFGEIPDPLSRAGLLSEVFKGDALQTLATSLIGKIESSGEVEADDAATIKKVFPRAFADTYLKKSQLALMEVAAFLSLDGNQIESTDLSICADYQLPKVLRSLGILTYGSKLAGMVDSLTLIDANSLEERAIRAATVLVCEDWAKIQRCSTAVVDNYLWLNRNLSNQPFHLTFTEAY